VSEFHSIGGCSFCPIDIPFRMDDDLFGSGTQVNPSDPSRSNGRVLGHGVRYRIRRRHVGFMARLDCHPTISSLTEFGAVRSSQGPLGAWRLATAFRATRDGQTCRRSSNRTWRKAQLWPIIYTNINMIASMLKPWLMLARNCLRCSALSKRSGQLRPYVRPVDANFVAGHHGCSLTCQAPIC